MTSLEPEPTGTTGQPLEERGADISEVSLYQHTVMYPDGDLLVHYSVIPARVLPNDLRATLASSEYPYRVVAALGMEKVDSEIVGPAVSSFLPMYIAAMLEGGDSSTVTSRLRDMQNRSLLAAFDNLRPELVHFAHYAAYAEVVPFEMSDVDFHALGTVGVLSLAVTTGSSLGVVAAGGTPLIILTVPLGIVLVGASLVAIVVMAKAADQLFKPKSGLGNRAKHWKL